MIEEIIEDKTKIEEKILELLNEFNTKHEEIIIKDVDLVHQFERNLQGNILLNKIVKVVLVLKEYEPERESDK